MSQADTRITSVDRAAQVDAGNIADLARDYHWLKAMFAPAHADQEINDLGEQVAAVVKTIANTRSQSIHDLRAKMAIFRLEEDGLRPQRVGPDRKLEHRSGRLTGNDSTNQAVAHD